MKAKHYVILVLIVVAFAGAGYFFYKKFNKKEEEEDVPVTYDFTPQLINPPLNNPGKKPTPTIISSQQDVRELVDSPENFTNLTRSPSRTINFN